MDEARPGYYAIIPADVRYDDSIPANAKLLYGEISALIGTEGFCYATNAYFMKIYGFSDPTVTRLITQLEKAGYIKRIIERDDSGHVSQRKIYLSVSMPEMHPPINFDSPSHQKKEEGGIKNDGYTNLSITNIEKENKKEKAARKKAVQLTDEQLHDLVVGNIATMAAPDWPREMKNEIYRLVMSLYDPEREVRKARPVRSEISVKATFRKLLLHSQGDPNVMLDMLYSAINGGWQGVQPPGNSRPAKVERPREERQYQCL